MEGYPMTHLSRNILVLTAALAASAALASGGDQDQVRQTLKDGSCLDQPVDGTAPECQPVADQVRLQQQLKDGSCLDGDGCGDAVRTRTRAGEENGAGTVERTRK